MLEPSAPTETRHDPYAPLRLRNFRVFILSILMMAMGAQVQAVVVAWQLYAITHDPLSLGMVGLAEAAPFLGLALLAGHAADVLDRRRLLLAAVGFLTLCALGLAALSWRLDGHPESYGALKWGIYACIVGCGAARSFLLPARNALAAEVVPPSLYASSVAWRTGVWQVAAVSGPAVGGVLFAWLGATASYLIDAALMAAAFVAVAALRVTRAPVAAAVLSLAASVREGLAFILRRRLFLGAMSLDLLAVLFGGAVAILPVFVSDILHAGPRALGLLRAAPAIGAVIMSAALALSPPPRRAGPTFLWAVAAFGVCMIGFAFSRVVWLSVAVLALSGAADMLSIYVRSTLVQVLVPRALLGRVSSVNQIFIGTSNEIGAFESGVAARLLGTVPSVVFGGVMTLLSAGVVAATTPELRRLGRIEASAAPEA